MCLIQNVSLSDYYCLPNKLFEYCFAEIPVLASNFPDISQTVEKYDLSSDLPEKVNKLTRIADDLGATSAQLAIAWLLKNQSGSFFSLC